MQRQQGDGHRVQETLSAAHYAEPSAASDGPSQAAAHAPCTKFRLCPQICDARPLTLRRKANSTATSFSRSNRPLCEKCPAPAQGWQQQWEGRSVGSDRDRVAGPGLATYALLGWEARAIQAVAQTAVQPFLPTTTSCSGINGADNGSCSNQNQQQQHRVQKGAHPCRT